MPGLGDYIRAAFSARPLGMPLPPNWIGLAGIGLLGLLNPAWWLVGAGLEIAYLAWLSHSARFRATVDGAALQARQGDERRRWAGAAEQLLAQAGPEGRGRYQALEARCREIAEQQRRIDPAAAAAHDEGLARLQWVYLRLLAGRASIARLVAEAGRGEAERLRERTEELTAQLKDGSLAEGLRTSIQGQLEIVQTRLAKQREAGDKLAYVEAELERIAEQVALLRDQALLTTEPGTLASRIDEITAGLGATSQWIEAQAGLGHAPDPGVAPSSVVAPPPAAAESAPPTPEPRRQRRATRT
jgi:hypothetical protein